MAEDTGRPIRGGSHSPGVAHGTRAARPPGLGSCWTGPRLPRAAPGQEAPCPPPPPPLGRSWGRDPSQICGGSDPPWLWSDGDIMSKADSAPGPPAGAGRGRGGVGAGSGRGRGRVALGQHSAWSSRRPWRQFPRGHVTLSCQCQRGLPRRAGLWGRGFRACGEGSGSWRGGGPQGTALPAPAGPQMRGRPEEVPLRDREAGPGSPGVRAAAWGRGHRSCGWQPGLWEAQQGQSCSELPQWGLVLGVGVGVGAPSLSPPRSPGVLGWTGPALQGGAQDQAARVHGRAWAWALRGDGPPQGTSAGLGWGGAGGGPWAWSPLPAGSRHHSRAWQWAAPSGSGTRSTLFPPCHSRPSPSCCWGLPWVRGREPGVGSPGPWGCWQGAGGRGWSLGPGKPTPEPQGATHVAGTRGLGTPQLGAD